MSKLERLSTKYHGSLFYPSDDKTDRKMLPIITDIYFETKYRVLYKNKHFENIRFITKEWSNFLERKGFKIEKIQKETNRVRKKLFNIPVRIESNVKKEDEEGYLIKFVGKNHESISKKMDLIKENLEYIGIKPKECIRERKDLEEDIDEEFEDEDILENDIENEDIEKEIEEGTILKPPFNNREILY